MGHTWTIFILVIRNRRMNSNSQAIIQVEFTHLPGQHECGVDASGGQHVIPVARWGLTSVNKARSLFFFAQLYPSSKQWHRGFLTGRMTVLQMYLTDLFLLFATTAISYSSRSDAPTRCRCPMRSHSTSPPNMTSARICSRTI